MIDKPKTDTHIIRDVQDVILDFFGTQLRHLCLKDKLDGKTYGFNSGMLKLESVEQRMLDSKLLSKHRKDMFNWIGDMYKVRKLVQFNEALSRTKIVSGTQLSDKWNTDLYSKAENDFRLALDKLSIMVGHVIEEMLDRNIQEIEC